MSESQPVSMLVLYRVKPGHDDTFVELLKKHYPALRDIGLATATPARIYRGESKRPAPHGGSTFVETFEWVDEKAAGVAHQTPEVMAVWEPMGPILDGMDLIALHPLEV
jgi:quinol monooxygenase YgiN